MKVEELIGNFTIAWQNKLVRLGLWNAKHKMYFCPLAIIYSNALVKPCRQIVKSPICTLAMINQPQE